jgi:lauroyl/myristoyl acyltransferase
MSSLRDAVVRSIYRLGWLGASRVPVGVVRWVIARGSGIAVRLDGLHVQVLRRNLAAATGTTPGPELMRAALASYLRNFYEVLALPGWPTDAVLSRVTTTGEDRLREAFSSTGAVVALPHSANWDLAGAWACRTGMPVTTVAERLGDAEFEDFVSFREGLGMEVLSHRDPGTMAHLMGAVRGGRLVCLVADRDLGGTGVPVVWNGHAVTMPGGPAMVARRTGAALIPAVCTFTEQGMHITFGQVVQPRPGRAGLVAMTQDVADFFAARIAGRPEDWHFGRTQEQELAP